MCRRDRTSESRVPTVVSSMLLNTEGLVEPTVESLKFKHVEPPVDARLFDRLFDRLSGMEVLLASISSFPYTHLRAHETGSNPVCRPPLEE